MELLVKTKKWGNSVAVVLPSSVVRQQNIKPGDELNLAVEKKGTVLRELYGALKFTKSTEALIKEARKDLAGKWLK
ncbi:AbrB/MazE/SpoVT family DNA-binding domain-containing protein [Candidatus Woesearchaeota archaeon]|nr:AbrB/MazE/SpoVT family DNA-binding domain-containing protein [Candidatus Woesearchaeota archaeon]